MQFSKHPNTYIVITIHSLQDKGSKSYPNVENCAIYKA